MDDITYILQLLRNYDNVKKEYQKALSAGGWPITGPQVGALRIIAKRPGLSVSELADTMGIHITTAEGYAIRLSDKGMLRAEKDSADKRRKLLWVTKTGEQVTGDVPLGYKSLLVHNLMNASVDEKKIIREGLKTLLEFMQERDE
jgi:DNA-binding MarR family transcriptional regulator